MKNQTQIEKLREKLLRKVKSEIKALERGKIDMTYSFQLTLDELYLLKEVLE